VNRPGDDAIEAAVLRALGRPGAAPATASTLAARLGRSRSEVDAALAGLAERGEIVRRIEQVDDRLAVSWRYARGGPR
jgi:DNA-binding MarR family transcriptional regulator